VERHFIAQVSSLRLLRYRLKRMLIPAPLQSPWRAPPLACRTPPLACRTAPHPHNTHNTAPQGFMLPYYHRNYWMGLRSVGWPTFNWVDPTVAAPSAETYTHWGSAGNASEPDNMFPQENCAVGNFTESYDGVWGWADTRCSNNFIFVCKAARECCCCAARPAPCVTCAARAATCSTQRCHAGAPPCPAAECPRPIAPQAPAA
jgi:hypothetical protein